jgi:hypothetical protein
MMIINKKTIILTRTIILLGLIILKSSKLLGQELTVNPTASPDKVCPGKIVQLDAGSAGGSGSYTYNWTSEPNGFSSSISNPGVNPVVTTTYKVDVFDGFTTVSSEVIVTVNPLPVVTFPVQPGISACIGVDITYTTQESMTNYTWGFPGTLNIDYSISSGGTMNSNAVTLKYLTAGSKIVTINYINVQGCKAAFATSSTSTTVNPLPTITAIYHQ